MTEKAKVQITTESYMAAGGPEVYPNLELVKPIAATCDDYFDNGISKRPANLEDRIAMVNARLYLKASEQGITHIFSVRYESNIGRRRAEYSGMGIGYREIKGSS